MNHTCGGCSATWTSLSWCHCASCHRTFYNLTDFDLHRAGTKKTPGGVCKEPDGFKEQGGVWATPAGHEALDFLRERAEQARAARGRK